VKAVFQEPVRKIRLTMSWDGKNGKYSVDIGKAKRFYLTSYESGILFKIPENPAP